MLFTTGIHIQMSKDYGGQAFPIFEQSEIKIGSDRVTCHIHLAAEFGVELEHVRLNRLTERDVTISPTSSSAAVFLWRANGRRFEQIYTTTALGIGDAFSLVSPQGPKFIFTLQEFPPEVQKARIENFNKRKAGTGRGRLNKESVLTEGKRQIWTRLLVLGPMQLIQRAFVFVQTGAIFQPRNIFLGLTLLSGYIIGGVSCYNSRKSTSLLDKRTQEYKDCENDKEALQKMGKNKEPSLLDLVYNITRSNEIRAALEEDNLLREEMLKRAGVLIRSKKYDWMLSGSGPRFVKLERWQKSIKNSFDEGELDSGTAHVLSWLGASSETSEYATFYNTEDDLVCGKGPLGLSYRQAINLGITAQPDALYEGLLNDLESIELREELIQITLAKAGVIEQYEEDEVPPTYEYGETSPNEQKHCIYRDVTDNRSQIQTLLRNLSQQIGPNARNLPDADFSNGVSSRIAKLYAAEIKGVDFTEDEPELIFDDQVVSIQVEDVGGKDASEWVISKTAEAFARAIVLPCMLVLENEEDARKALFEAEDGGPPVVSCMYLHYKLTKGTK
ncbi:MAG: hypothetical protein ACON4U_13070 [Myxococcota bacterium]